MSGIATAQRFKKNVRDSHCETSEQQLQQKAASLHPHLHDEQMGGVLNVWTKIRDSHCTTVKQQLQQKAASLHPHLHDERTGGVLNVWTKIRDSHCKTLEQQLQQKAASLHPHLHDEQTAGVLNVWTKLGIATAQQLSSSCKCKQLPPPLSAWKKQRVRAGFKTKRHGYPLHTN